MIVSSIKGQIEVVGYLITPVVHFILVPSGYKLPLFTDLHTWNFFFFFFGGGGGGALLVPYIFFYNPDTSTCA